MIVHIERLTPTSNTWRASVYFDFQQMRQLLSCFMGRGFKVGYTKIEHGHNVLKTMTVEEAMQ
jgi:hypothetical protein